MRYAVIEESPKGEFSLPVMDDGSQILFESLSEAIEFTKTLQNPKIVKVSDVLDSSLVTPLRLKNFYEHMAQLYIIDFKDFLSKKKEVVKIKDAVRYVLYNEYHATLMDIARMEDVALGKTTNTHHTTIIHSVDKIRHDIVNNKSLVHYIIKHL